MYVLYLGNDPDISMTNDKQLILKLARGIISFTNERQAMKHAQANDNKLSGGFPYYSCWKDGEVIFVS